jgi:hypothetical protein
MKRFSKLLTRVVALFALTVMMSGCPFDGDGAMAGEETSKNGRLVMFVGIDISGSFMNTKSFDDSLDFMAHYLYGHLQGSGGLEVPGALFVGSIGGATQNEPKTFYPIQAFENKSIAEIRAKLREIFPVTKQNPFTDFNAFFQQINEFVKNKNLVLRPISIVMLSDGKPDAPGTDPHKRFRSIQLKPLENLARKVTLRLLYTDAVVGMDWQTKVPRQRVRIWTQDANVMKDWKDEKIFQPELEFAQKARFFSWIKDNVDFSVRVRRVR